MQHSKIVGGSTAKRVIRCPGSVPLVQQMPPQIGSKYAEEGTKLHGLMERFIEADTVSAIEMMKDLSPEQREKIEFCLGALDEIDPQNQMTYVHEVEVEFEGVPALEGVFGNADLVGRIGDRAVILDWKFGDGVMVEAEENEQGLFYAAAAMKTSKVQWAFDGAEEIEIVIVQPPHVRRWVTTFKRVHEFERELVVAVQTAQRADAPTVLGDHCRWCTAKPICPQMTGQIDRVTHTALATVDSEALGQALAMADRLEDFIAEARKLAQARLEKGLPVPGYKLVPKRPVRQWADEKGMHVVWLNAGIDPTVYQEIKLRSPAQMEKVCKEHGVTFPANQVVSVSSGNTIAPEGDPRPAVLVIGEQLRAALNRVQ
jgi:hypothetical protein